VRGLVKSRVEFPAGNSLAASPLVNSLAGFAREYGGSAARSPAPESRQLRRLCYSCTKRSLVPNSFGNEVFKYTEFYTEANKWPIILSEDYFG